MLLQAYVTRMILRGLPPKRHMIISKWRKQKANILTYMYVVIRESYGDIITSYQYYKL